MENNDYERYQKAQKKVKEIKGFYSNLITYILVISFLAFINLRYSPKHLSFFYPILGWGIGVFFHAMGVFDFFPFWNYYENILVKLLNIFKIGKNLLLLRKNITSNVHN